MVEVALALAVLALLVALAARSRAASFARELEDLRTDVRRRTSAVSEEAEESVRLLQEMLARVVDGEAPDGEMIREGRLWRDVTSDEALTLLEGGGIAVLDVRTPQETAGGVIPGATRVPIDELEERLGDVPRGSERTLVYCAGGGRSAAACEFLSRKGFTGLHNLAGGIGAWPGPVAPPV